MASSGRAAEFARLPASRKVLVFAVIGGVMGLGYWKLIYQSLDEQLEAAQAEHDTKARTRQRLSDDLPKYEHLRTHLTKLREQIEKNQAALPNEAEVPAFFETLQRKVAESGVEIRKWSNRNEEPVESFVKVPVEIELTGTFMQIKRFFASLIQRDVRLSPSPDSRANDARERDARERIVSIENLALNSPTVKNRELILTAKFTAVTFRQADKPASPDKPAAAGAGRPPPPNPPSPPASATPSSAPPPPLPSAAPAAAGKVRVEQAPGTGPDRLKGGL